jgi:hypothetical protein
LLVRRRIPFRSVNCPGRPGHVEGMQRHHLLPLQLLGKPAFRAMLDALGPERVGFDDFRCNGLLLPAVEKQVLRLRLPLHRGPHRIYNEVVDARVGQIERAWANATGADHQHASEHAMMRMRLLQRALRRQLLAPRRMHYNLNNRDPLGHGIDFSELDAMADTLWAGTGEGSS